MWRRLSIICVIAWQLGGCAIWSKGPPSCDGLARRPLNRSLWDWETGTPLAAPEPPVLPSDPIIRKGDASSSPSSTSSAITSFAPSRFADSYTSYRPCGKET
jgi:type IV secretion system protein VirB7